MKITASLLCCFTAVNLFAQTNQPPKLPQYICWTNKLGVAIEGAKVVRVDPDGLIWVLEEGAGGGKALFKDLPVNIQQRFGYNPTNAAQFAQNKEIEKSKAAAAQANAAADVIEQRKRQMLRDKLARFKPQGIKCFQKTKGGMLAEDNYGTIFFMDDYPYTSGLTDGDWFSATVYPCGEFKYDTVGGSSKTVRRYTVDMERSIDYSRSRGEY